MFDKSKPPAAGSKWRRALTAGKRARADATDQRLRVATAALEAGLPPPVQQRRSRVKPTAHARANPDETAALWAFLGDHGRDIALLLARTRNEAEQLAVARAYREVLNGSAGGHDRWVRTLCDLGL